MNSENKIVRYFAGVRQEWHKITWPEWIQVKGETFMVLGIVAIFTIVILVYDLIFSGIFSLGIFKKWL